MSSQENILYVLNWKVASALYLQYHITVAKRRKRSVIRNPKKDKKMQRRKEDDKWLERWVETAQDSTAGKDSSESISIRAEWKQAGVL